MTPAARSTYNHAYYILHAEERRAYQAEYRDKRSERKIAKAAGLGVNTIRHFRNTGNIQLDTLTMLCNTLGLEVVVREKGK